VKYLLAAGGAVLHDHRAFSYLSVQDIPINQQYRRPSSHLALVTKNFHEHIRRFYRSTGIELPGRSMD
jgi:hypothetical protein